MRYGVGQPAKGNVMKFLVTYRERKADFDPAAAQRRAGRLLTERAMPPGLKVHQLLSSIGGGGGYAVVETAEATDLQHLASLFSAYDCRIEPVIDLSFVDAIRPGPPETPRHPALPEMPPAEPHEGAFSDDDVYDTED